MVWRSNDQETVTAARRRRNSAGAELRAARANISVHFRSLEEAASVAREDSRLLHRTGSVTRGGSALPAHSYRGLGQLSTYSGHLAATKATHVLASATHDYSPARDGDRTDRTGPDPLHEPDWTVMWHLILLVQLICDIPNRQLKLIVIFVDSYSTFFGNVYNSDKTLQLNSPLIHYVRSVQEHRINYFCFLNKCISSVILCFAIYLYQWTALLKGEWY